VSLTTATLGRAARVENTVCADVIRLQGAAEICGDAVSPKETGNAIGIGVQTLVDGSVYPPRVDGSVISAGGAVLHSERCRRSQQCGMLANIGECVTSSDPSV